MKTTIKNNERVFFITTSTGKQYFCNIEQLNEVCKGMNEGYFKIFDFWNNKQKKVSKKSLIGFFESANIKQEFHY